MSYRVKTVCAMTGIPRPTLLAWERRYQILDVNRSEAGHRIYVDADVAILRALKSKVDEGFSIGEAVRLTRSSVMPAEPGLGMSAPRPAAAVGWLEPTELVRRLIVALKEYDREAAQGYLVHIRQLSFENSIDQVFVPLLRQVGQEWRGGTLSIAQEHYASGWCREQLMAMFHGLGSGPVGGPRAVCALAPNETHELGLLVVCIHLMLAGWRVTWLGANLPIEELCRYLTEEGPELVCLSVVEGHTPAQVTDWAKRLREAALPDTIVALGGPCAVCDVPGVVVPKDAPSFLELLRGRRR